VTKEEGYVNGWQSSIISFCKKNQRHLIVQKGRESDFVLKKTRNLARLMRHVELPPIVSRTFPKPRGRASERLVAGGTGAEAARALDNLLLGNGDDVDVDGVELGNVSVVVKNRQKIEKLTPRDLRRSLVSWSTSSMPDSEFWVKSRAETSGTY
jgi:hypothetical protein